MENSIVIARFLAIWFVVFGSIIIFRHDFLKQVWINFYSNPAIMFVVGILYEMVGLLILVLHPGVTFDWSLTITLVGALFFLIGVGRLFYPLLLRHSVDQMLHSNGYIYVGSALVLLGFWFALFGWVAI